MRKALVCAALLAAGLASSMAQSNVYSLNVVGYYNLTVGAGQRVMIANQLNTTNNTLEALIPNGPPNAQFFKFVNGGFSGWTFDSYDLVWEQNGQPVPASMNPGEGGFYVTPAATTLTFVGEVEQGSLTNLNLASGQKRILSSIVPQQGRITTDLGLPGGPNDQLFTYNTAQNNGAYVTWTFDSYDLQWEQNGQANEPVINVGQAFFYIQAPANTASWVRNFTVQ
ncbi:MAG TPA: hypothetical protein VMU04_10915 [Candidatus Acidoferrum sp.]|nr:hypothetical protein [Candidatus Acidoferrum sp.]